MGPCCNVSQEGDHNAQTEFLKSLQHADKLIVVDSFFNQK